MENKDLESLCHLNAHTCTRTHMHTHTGMLPISAALVQMEIFQALPAQMQLLLRTHLTCGGKQFAAQVCVAAKLLWKVNQLIPSEVKTLILCFAEVNYS